MKNDGNSPYIVHKNCRNWQNVAEKTTGWVELNKMIAVSEYHVQPVIYFLRFLINLNHFLCHPINAMRSAYSNEHYILTGRAMPIYYIYYISAYKHKKSKRCTCTPSYRLTTALSAIIMSAINGTGAMAV